VGEPLPYVRSVRFIAFGLALALVAAPAVAQHHDGDYHGGYHGDHYHDGHFDYDAWRGGHWYHGWHDGRIGWWWTVGPGWYYYPAPVYPYPAPYPAVVAAPQPNAWYYCPTARQYYPYVPSCDVPWQAVPATPAPQPAPAAPPQAYPQAPPQAYPPEAPPPPPQ
jgi:hypothetical protein